MQNLSPLFQGLLRMVWPKVREFIVPNVRHNVQLVIHHILLFLIAKIEFKIDDHYGVHTLQASLTQNSDDALQKKLTSAQAEANLMKEKLKSMLLSSEGDIIEQATAQILQFDRALR